MLAALPREDDYGGSAPYVLFGVLTAYPSKKLWRSEEHMVLR
jgi:hypothetical protein